MDQSLPSPRPWRRWPVGRIQTWVNFTAIKVLLNSFRRKKCKNYISQKGFAADVYVKCQSVFMFPKFKRYANTKVCPWRVYKCLPSSFTHSFVVPFIAIHVSPSQQFGFRFLGIAHRWFSFWHSVHIIYILKITPKFISSPLLLEYKKSWFKDTFVIKWSMQNFAFCKVNIHISNTNDLKGYCIEYHVIFMGL